MPCMPSATSTVVVCKIKRMTIVKRREAVKDTGCCYNCFGTSHTREWCRSRKTCSHCNHNHHSMLHLDDRKRRTPKQCNCQRTNDDQKYQREVHRTSNNGQPSSSCDSIRPDKIRPKQKFIKERLGGRPMTHIFMPTALAKVLAANGPSQARILLNSGVAHTIILDDLTRRLKLKTSRKNDSTFCTINLQSFYDSSSKIQICGMVRDQFNTPLPETTNERKLEKLYDHLTELADPHFCKPTNIEILIGNDQIPMILKLKAGLIQTSSNMPIAQSTVFGWTLSGACRY